LSKLAAADFEPNLDAIAAAIGKLELPCADGGTPAGSLTRQACLVHLLTSAPPVCLAAGAWRCGASWG